MQTTQWLRLGTIVNSRYADDSGDPDPYRPVPSNFLHLLPGAMRAALRASRR